MLCVVATATAQTAPFGKNKIQYRHFDWQVLSGENVDVYYYPEEEKLADLTLAYAEESFRFLVRKFQHHPSERVPLIVYSSPLHFEQTNILPGFIPEGVLGFTEYTKRRVALPFRGDYAQFRQTLRHELVHFFQISKLQATGFLRSRQRHGSPQAVHWWTEGLAEFWSVDESTDHDMYVQDMVLNGRLPSIRQFTYMYTYASYPLGAELHRYLSRRFGDEYIVRMYEEFWKYETFEEALESILGVSLDQLSREWAYDLRQKYFPLYGDRPPPEVGAKPVIFRGGANYKPLVFTMPGDTTMHLLFTSPRSGYTNIYRTRLDAGERDVTTVIRGQRTAEFETLHAWESRMSVDSRGVLAFISRFQERDALFLYDLETEEVVGRYQWPDLVGLRSPSWSPDGERIVFEGLTSGGFSGLYVLEFETQQRTSLTEDRFRDQDPDWSPDGRFIVFASDRTVFGDEGSMNLFLYDLDSDELDYLTFGPHRDRQPRFSPDNDYVIFSSDRTGIFDIYQVSLDGQGKQLTAKTGGLFDPQWLPNGDGLVLAGFSEGRFSIFQYSFSDTADTLPTFGLHDAVVCDEMADMLATTGKLPMGWEWTELDAGVLQEAEERPYRTWREFSLDFAAGDAIVAPGLGAAQGAQLLASDMLGDHILFAGISSMQTGEIGDLLDDFSGQLMYLNLSRRLNFGVGLYRYKGMFLDVAWDLYHETTHGGYFLASYPFSRFQRLEFHLGLEHSDRVDLEDGYFGISPRPDTRDKTRKGFLTSNYLSYVKDNALWLPTGPIDGERYNITAGFVSCFLCTVPSEVTGEPVRRSAVAESFVLSGDYRRYFRTSLYSAYAIRAYGYFSDGAIPGRTVLGGTHRLRGYPRYSLAGSRVWLLNQEWRFPLLHGLSFGFPFGELRFPGLQGGLFADIGTSWLEDKEPEGAWGSYGLGLRMPLGGALVLRFDTGRRFRFGELPPVRFGAGHQFNDTFVDFFIGFNY